MEKVHVFFFVYYLLVYVALQVLPIRLRVVCFYCIRIFICAYICFRLWPSHECLFMCRSCEM